MLLVFTVFSEILPKFSYFVNFYDWKLTKTDLLAKKGEIQVIALIIILTCSLNRIFNPMCYTDYIYIKTSIDGRKLFNLVSIVTDPHSK